MIANSRTCRQFHGLIRYLLHGRSGEEHERVAWTECRNLALDDAEHTATLMRATAAQNHRVELPVYHLILAFDPSDLPDAATMRQVAQRVLDELRLTEHQTLTVAHRDRAHAHLHIVANRVHPETHRAWDRWRDHTIAERALRILERQLGLREVDGRLHQLPGHDLPPLKARAHRREAPDPVEPLAPDRRRVVDEAARRLIDFDLLRHVGRLELESQRRLAEEGARQARCLRTERELDAASQAMYRALDRAYARPLEALRRFDEVLYRDGPAAATRRLRDDPTSYVELRPYARAAYMGLWHKTDDNIALGYARTAVPAAQEYALAIERHRTAVRGLEPGLTRTTYDDDARAVAEHAAHRARFEREMARLRRVREHLPHPDILRKRARTAVYALNPRELAQLNRSLGPAVGRVIELLAHRVVREIALGRDQHSA